MVSVNTASAPSGVASYGAPGCMLPPPISN